MSNRTGNQAQSIDRNRYQKSIDIIRRLLSIDIGNRRNQSHGKNLRYRLISILFILIRILDFQNGVCYIKQKEIIFKGFKQTLRRWTNMLYRSRNVFWVNTVIASVHFSTQKKKYFINWACLDWAAQLKNSVSVSSFCKGRQSN